MAKTLDSRLSRLEDALPDAMARQFFAGSVAQDRIAAVKAITGHDIAPACERLGRSVGREDDDSWSRLSNRELDLLIIVLGMCHDAWLSDLPQEQRDALNALLGEPGRVARDEVDQLHLDQLSDDELRAFARGKGVLR